MMQHKTIQADPCITQNGKRAGAGENGLARLLSEKASALVAEVHALSGRKATDDEMLAMKSRLSDILSDSGAHSLRGIETDIIPLRCRGDPFDMGRISNMLDAVSECRDYVAGELSRRGVDDARQTACSRQNG